MGINLLREGLDIPEVGLIGIFDADKEGFLRSTRALLQTIGRAARNVNGRVILYASKKTNSIQMTLKESDRRRKIQEEYNQKHNITPTSIIKKIQEKMVRQIEEVAEPDPEYKKQPKNIPKYISTLEKRMIKLAKNLDFEEAIKLRDEVNHWKRIDLELIDLN